MAFAKIFMCARTLVIALRIPQRPRFAAAREIKPGQINESLRVLKFADLLPRFALIKRMRDRVRNLDPAHARWDVLPPAWVTWASALGKIRPSLSRLMGLLLTVVKVPPFAIGRDHSAATVRLGFQERWP